MPKKRRVRRHQVTQPQDPSYKLIALTKGQNAIVDAADYEWLSQWNWIASWHPGKKSYYAQRAISSDSGRTTIKMSRALLDCSADYEVDHRNGNTLDNRRDNLRICTHSENQKNRKGQYGTSRFKGVARNNNRWRAQIMVDGKRIWLGRFNSEENAARAYDEAATKHHGAFAKINFPVPERGC